MYFYNFTLFFRTQLNHDLGNALRLLNLQNLHQGTIGFRRYGRPRLVLYAKSTQEMLVGIEILKASRVRHYGVDSEGTSFPKKELTNSKIFTEKGYSLGKGIAESSKCPKKIRGIAPEIFRPNLSVQRFYG